MSRNVRNSRSEQTSAYVTEQGNVRVIRNDSASVTKPAGIDAVVHPDEAWSVRDGAGSVLEAGLTSRTEALRQLGCHASRGARLPVQAWSDGQPTGDRIG